MRIIFESASLDEMIDQMEATVRAFRPKNIFKTVSENAEKSGIPSAAPVAKAQGPGPDPFTVETPVDKPVDKPLDILGTTPAKPKRARTPKQLENDEKLRAAALEKIEAKKAAKAAAKAAANAPPPLPEIPPIPTAEGMDPAEVVKLRQKTIEDLQSAYANGYQKEVFELLARFGNGAKSFRELPPESFVPIRHAIDHGALT